MADERSQAVHVIGGGLAGSEVAWQIAASGVPVVLHEMRPLRMTAAHKSAALAELVCSNSFRSDDKELNAVGLLHEEMRRLGSLIMRTADANQVPAGTALAVDRDGFAAAVTEALAAHPLIDIRREEIAGLPPADWDSVIIATGPLTSRGLAARTPLTSIVRSRANSMRRSSTPCSRERKSPSTTGRRPISTAACRSR